jgi:hypothetical protein
MSSNVMTVKVRLRKNCFYIYGHSGNCCSVVKIYQIKNKIVGSLLFPAFLLLSSENFFCMSSAVLKICSNTVHYSNVL